MILYFSGTGNSAFAARMLAEITHMETMDMTPAIRSGGTLDIPHAEKYVIVAPTYAWMLPEAVTALLTRSDLQRGKDAYFVMTCASGIGGAGWYIRQLCAEKGLVYKGVAKVAMPENYVVMLPVPKPDKAREIVNRSVPVLQDIGKTISEGGTLSQKTGGVIGRMESGPFNKAFRALFIGDKKFRAGDGCTGCGLCERLCPVGNISLNSKPVWNGRCIHCMACISACPAGAIEYGRASVGKPRHYIKQ